MNIVSAIINTLILKEYFNQMYYMCKPNNMQTSRKRNADGVYKIINKEINHLNFKSENLKIQPPSLDTCPASRPEDYGHFTHG